MPTNVPTPSVCDFTYLPCDSTVTGTTVNHGSFVGGPAPDVNFVIIVEAPERLIATTCDPNDPEPAFETYLWLYPSCPGENPTHNVSFQQSHFGTCGYLDYDAVIPGTYW